MIEVGNIKINTIQKVKEFSSVIMLYEGNAEVHWGRYVVDAKSILGLFSLDIQKPLTLYVSDNTSEGFDNLISELKIAKIM